MADVLEKVKPDRAWFMARLFLFIAAGWGVVGWNVESQILSTLAYMGAVAFLYLGITAFDGTITLSSHEITQTRLFRKIGIEFEKVERIDFYGNKQAARLMIAGAGKIIAAHTGRFERVTIMRLRREISERAPNALGNSLSDVVNHFS